MDDSATQEKEVDHVQEEEAEGQVEGVHQNLAEELDLKPEPVQLLGKRVSTEVVESRIVGGLLVVDMGEVILGGGKEHVKSRLETRSTGDIVS